ncbi:MAG: DNA-directed RNA polymerase subunit omega [Ignavibacteria bacterium GWB2_35_6b]|nr:MAG: DNA-directed RNA polymerase subunit omega [Ignavibacteria bacterium GWB2_35_6b]
MNRIIPVDLRRVEGVAANVYEAIIAAGKRARQINDDNRLEYNTILNSLAVGNDDDFEEKENPDQLKAALEFEKRPKPHLQAMEQVLNSEVKYRYKEDEITE